MTLRQVLTEVEAVAQHQRRQVASPASPSGDPWVVMADVPAVPRITFKDAAEAVEKFWSVPPEERQGRAFAAALRALPEAIQVPLAALLFFGREVIYGLNPSAATLWLYYKDCLRGPHHYQYAFSKIQCAEYIAAGARRASVVWPGVLDTAPGHAETVNITIGLGPVGGEE